MSVIRHSEIEVLGDTDAGFPNTSWTLLDILNHDAHPHRQDALSHLSQTYWPPVYAFLRRQGKTRDESAELTQSFFSDIVLSNRLFERADRTRGRLRSLICQSVKNFVATNGRRERRSAAIHSFNLDHLSAEEALVSPDELTPEATFDRRWALSVLQDALRRCEQQFQSASRLRWWRAYEMRVLRPAVASTEMFSYAEIARELGFKSDEDARSAVRQVNKRLLLLLRQIVAETTLDQESRVDEFRDVFEILA